ncbi:MAG: hypothetical protein LUH15_10125 [Tannerellaceae bacterium]|nr:hypothetical protein [Tannerellaceae bacterium]
MLDFENGVCIESYILSYSQLDKMSDDKVTSTPTLKELEKIFVLLYEQYKDPLFQTLFDNLPPLHKKKYIEMQQELLGGGNWKFRLNYLSTEESKHLQKLYKKDSE